MAALHLLIIIALANYVEPFDLQNLLGYDDLYTVDRSFFDSTAYLLTYIILCNAALEVSIIIVIHFKQNSFYVAEHWLINFLVVLGQTINNFVAFKNDKYNLGNRFLHYELAIFTAELGQFALGILLNRRLLLEQVSKGIFILRLGHKWLGRLIYISIKL